MALGARVFAERCHRCHTLFGERPPVPPFENGAPSLDEVKPEAAYVRERIDRGGFGMATFAQEIPLDEQRAIERYVFEVAGWRVELPRSGDADPAQLRQGEQVFRSNCQGCHQIDGRSPTGDPTYPGTNFDEVRPSEWLVRHRAHNGLGVWMPAFKHKLSDAQIRAVARYVNAVAGGRPAPASGAKPAGATTP